MYKIQTHIFELNSTFGAVMSRQGAHTLKTCNDFARTIQSRYKHPNPYTRPVSDGLLYWQLLATSGNNAIATGHRTVPSAARYRLHNITVPYPYRYVTPSTIPA